VRRLCKRPGCAGRFSKGSWREPWGAGKNPDKTVFSLYPKARAKTLLKNALHTLGAYKGGALQYGLYYKEK
jgi:hypothetical protein